LVGCSHFRAARRRVEHPPIAGQIAAVGEVIAERPLASGERQALLKLDESKSMVSDRLASAKEKPAPGFVVKDLALYAPGPGVVLVTPASVLACSEPM
jgi:hypothetical protein